MSEGRAVAGALVIAMAWLTTNLIGITDARAENAIDGARNLSDSGAIACGRGPFPRTSRVPGIGGHGANTPPIDDKTADIQTAADTSIWKSITLGAHDSANSFREALKAARCRVGSLAGKVLERPQFPVSNTRRQVNLAVLSVADLGFGPAGASRAQIYRRAAQLGLGLCPFEVAPQLRLQYVDQPLGESLHIATKPVPMAGGDAAELIVGNGGAGLFLVAVNARPELAVPPNVRFVFVHDPTGHVQTTAESRPR